MDPAVSPPPSRFGVGTVMARTFEVWRKNPIPFVVAALVMDAPSTLATVLQNVREARGEPQGSAAVLSLLGTTLLTGMLTFGTLESLAGRPVRLGDMFSIGLRRFRRVIWIGLSTSFLILVALLALVVPGLMVMSALWLAIPAAIAEPDAELSPLQRSRRLTDGNRWPIFAALLLFIVLALVAYSGVVLATELLTRYGGGAGAMVAIAVTTAVSAVASGLHATAPAVAFHQLRALKEGGDTRTLARVFE